MDDQRGWIGATLGRFIVRDKLGEGGMGVVLVAHDPELDRRVAIKVLHPPRDHELRTAPARARLQREAQAMARLSHPNVVSVYDVGEDAERVFIAMELVEGTTLRRWREEAPRSWREILALYLQAGEGLAAGHDAGLVHRDFKPENVLVSHDGKARVADFGLARTAEEPAGRNDERETASNAAGTPRYMAPEQWLGKPIDARTDQFAYCVALWEALYSELPFADPEPSGRAGGTESAEVVAADAVQRSAHLELCVRTLLGRRRDPPRESQVPPKIGRVLERGLERDPDARYPELRALLDLLSRELQPPRYSRWRVVAVAAASSVAVATTVWLVARESAREVVDPCARAAVALDDTWGSIQERGVAGAFAATGRPHAAEVARRVVHELDRYAESWRAMRREVCMSSRVLGVQSSTLMDLRMQCLDRRLGELDGLVRVLQGGAAPTAVDRAIPAVQELTPVKACADATELTAVQPLPSGASARTEILALERRLDEVEGLRRTGAYQAALADATPIVETARRQGYAPTLARALENHGWLLRQTGAAEQAEAVTHAAIRAAAEGRVADLEAAAWTNLLHVVGVMRERATDAAVIRTAAEAAVARSGNPRLRARLAVTVGTITNRAGAYADAAAHAEAELAAVEAALGPDDLDVAAVVGIVSAARWDLGRFEDALAASRRVIEVRERVLGAAHPAVGAGLVMLGAILNERGRYREGREALERAVRILEGALGPDHAEVATALNNLAGSISGEGDLEGARKLFERVLAIRERTFGTSSPQVALALNNLGQMLIELGRGANAEPLLRRSLAIRERAFGPDHATVAETLTNLAWALDVTGRCVEAVPLYDRAVAIAERTYGRDHPRVASPLSGRGLCLIERRPEDAIAALERAARLIADGSDPGLLAMTRFGLARALARLGRDPARVRELAEQARAFHAARSDLKEAESIDRWLRDRR